MLILCSAILNYRPPRSIPELASRLATLQYYQNFLPLMKRLAIPLYKVLKDNKFVWTKVESESYSNLLYLMSLQIRNWSERRCADGFVETCRRPLFLVNFSILTAVAKMA